MIILTLNCGSSSAKYQVYDWEKKQVLGNGIVERIGEVCSTIENNTLGKETFIRKQACPTHKESIELIINTIIDKKMGNIIDFTNPQFFFCYVLICLGASYIIFKYYEHPSKIFIRDRWDKES